MTTSTLVQKAAGPGRGPSSTPDPSAGAVETIASLARGLLRQIPEMTGRLVDAIYGRDQNYREHRLVPDDDLRRSCSENLREYICALTLLPDQREVPLAVALATGQRRAEQGLPLESLLRAFRLGGIVVWESLLREAACRPEVPSDQLLEGAVLVWEMTDLYSSEVAFAYQRAQAELHHRDATQRQTLLHALFTGTASDTDLSQAPDILSLGPAGPFLVGVAESSRETGDSLAAALRAQGIRSEWLARQDRLVGLLSPSRPGCPASRAVLAASGSLRAGLSPEVESLRQVATAYRLAELALKAIPPGKVEVASLDDRIASVLLVASPDLAQRLVRRALGPILDPATGDRGPLLRTLRLYLDSGGSVAKVAQRVPCHRNTVFNRLTRIQDLTGLSPAEPREMTELCLALQAIDLLGIGPTRT
ncbi:MAG: PucR family transcriptional regulator [Candidatus Dormibacteria bacterium]